MAGFSHNATRMTISPLYSVKMINHPFLRVTGLLLQCVFVLTVYLDVSQSLQLNTRLPKSIIVNCVLTFV